MKDEPLIMWTIYDHPPDLPEFYVARAYKITSQGPLPSHRAVAHKKLENLQQLMREMGLVKLMRNAEDDPVIVETWI